MDQTNTEKNTYIKTDNDLVGSHYNIDKGLRPDLEGLLSKCMSVHASRKPNPGLLAWGMMYCSHKPECIVTTNPNRSVLITIITYF